jgi:hypothetical protein
MLYSTDGFKIGIDYWEVVEEVGPWRHVFEGYLLALAPPCLFLSFCFLVTMR